MAGARRCSGVLYFLSCVLLLLLGVSIRRSAALNPSPLSHWRCSTSSPVYYIYFGSNVISNFGNFCTTALGSAAAEPTLTEYASPCLSAYTRDLALDQYDTTEFAAAGGSCYPNRTGACTSATIAVYICRAVPLTTFQIGLPQCPLLTTDNGLWEYPSGRQFPSFARLVCNTGYKLSNPANYFTVSQSNSKWNLAAFNASCTVVTCPPSQSIANGNLQIGAMTYNSMATLLCTGPTALAGSSTSVCQNDGTWSVPNGRCVVQSGTLTCATALPIANGHLLITSTTINATATMVCDNDYVLVGSGSSTCQGGGIWSTPSGACQITCPQYQTVADGLLSISANTVSSTASTVCNANYVLVGISGSATCQSKGIWTTPTGTCQQRCTTLPTILNGGFLFRSDSPGSTTTVVCNAGFVVSSGSTTSTCTAGAWTPVTATCQKRCTMLPTITNGGFLYTTGNPGSTATAICNTGYTLTSGTRTSTCTSGTWTTPSGTCQQRCTTSPTITNGGFLYTTGNPGNPSSTATAVCNTGYTLTGGAGTSTCTSGSWTTPAGNCQKVCPQMQLVSRGILKISSFAVNAVATTQCDAGNFLVGNGNAMCQAAGTWSSTTGSCQARCTSAPTITNGNFLYATGNPGNPSSTATAVCNTGYTLTGGAGTSTCTSGSWTAPGGACQRVCPQMQLVTNGILKISSFAVNAVATTQCDAGYVLVGNGNAMCEAGGTWSSTTGSCLARCTSAPTITNGGLLFSSDNPGSTATVVCDTGYTLTNGAGTSNCTSGTWTTPAGTCERTCPQYQTFGNGLLLVTSNAVNSAATIVCHTNFALVGGGTATCQSSGAWTRPTGTCQLRCTTVPTIVNGRLLFSSDHPGSTATVTCNTGYTLTGGAGTSACSGGSWNSPAGNCQRTCPQYRTVTNGLLSITNNTVSSLATAVCNANYALVGSGSATCQSSGIWSTPTGGCQKRCAAMPTISNGRPLYSSDEPGSLATLICNPGYTLTGGSATSTCTSGLWTSPAGMCERVCPLSQSVTNGLLAIINNTVNETAYTVCNAGYVLVGDGNATCDMNGQWSTTAGLCQARCTSAPTITNGGLLYTTGKLGNPGSTATVVCNTGYTFTGGSRTSICSNGMWTTPSGICERTCPQYKTVSNGLLAIMSNTLSSTATTVCNASHVLVGSGSSTCQPDGTWSTPTGTCQATTGSSGASSCNWISETPSFAVIAAIAVLVIAFIVLLIICLRRGRRYGANIGAEAMTDLGPIKRTSSIGLPLAVNGNYEENDGGVTLENARVSQFYATTGPRTAKQTTTFRGGQDDDTYAVAQPSVPTKNFVAGDDTYDVMQRGESVRAPAAPAAPAEEGATYDVLQRGESVRFPPPPPALEDNYDILQRGDGTPILSAKSADPDAMYNTIQHPVPEPSVDVGANEYDTVTGTKPRPPTQPKPSPSAKPRTPYVNAPSPMAT